MSEEILAIGLHGLVSPDEAPARSEPILATSDQRVVTVNEEGRFEIEAFTHDPDSWDRATRLPDGLRARPGHLFLVLGPADLALLRERARSVGELAAEGDHLEQVRVGECTVVYASAELVGRVWMELREGLKSRVEDLAAHPGDELEDAGWRLLNVAIDEEDEVFALAALRLSESPDWRDAVGGIFLDDQDSRLEEVERRAQALARRPQRSGGGRLGELRQLIHRRFRPRADEAA